MMIRMKSRLKNHFFLKQEKHQSKSIISISVQCKQVRFLKVKERQVTCKRKELRMKVNNIALRMNSLFNVLSEMFDFKRSMDICCRISTIERKLFDLLIGIHDSFGMMLFVLYMSMVVWAIVVTTTTSLMSSLSSTLSASLER